MKKYVGSWSANNGSTYGSGYASNNKKALAKMLRKIAIGNVFAGNTGSWSIYESDDLECNYAVLSGTVRG